ncbi:unnamed protein product [Pleuronectes platessa]|uniref:Uncharacterized protein n=1 Tax=Pleuronectes platessa TaxID=8262 RepID=A0A9N7TMW6_PLEPL|nr:unnamed protein product [Pleuronectes platessa]
MVSISKHSDSESTHSGRKGGACNRGVCIIHAVSCRRTILLDKSPGPAIRNIMVRAPPQNYTLRASALASEGSPPLAGQDVGCPVALVACRSSGLESVCYIQSTEQSRDADGAGASRV